MSATVSLTLLLAFLPGSYYILTYFYVWLKGGTVSACD